MRDSNQSASVLRRPLPLTHAISLRALLLASALCAAATGQITTENAPSGNLQALTMSGSMIVGDTITARVAAPAGSFVILGVSSAPGDLDTGSGHILLDLAQVVPLTFLGFAGSDNQFTVTATVPPGLAVGATAYLQGAICQNCSPSAPSLQFTNRAICRYQGALDISVLSPAAGVLPTQTVVLHEAHVSVVVAYDEGADPATLMVLLTGPGQNATPLQNGMTRSAAGASGQTPPLVSGTYTITASIAAAGGALTTATIRNFEVALPSTTGPTIVRGYLLDPVGPTPIVGASIFFDEGGSTVLTDNQGQYTILDAPIGVGVHINFDPTSAGSGNLGPGEYYPVYKRPISVVEGALNTPDPCYLPKITPLAGFGALDQQGIFSCAQKRFLQAYTVENTQLGVRLHIPAGTHVTFLNDANPCTQQLSIAPVDRDHAPSNLPADLRPALLITVQPTGMRFWVTPPSGTNPGTPQRLPIDFPNTDDLALANEMDLFSVDHETGQFAVMGRMRATHLRNDPQFPLGLIETIPGTGGLQGGSWHCTCPPAPVAPPPPPSCGDACCDGTCMCPNPEVSLRNGFINETFHLPKRRIFDTPWGPDLSYNSQRLASNLVVRLNVTIPQVNAVPPLVSLTAMLDGMPNGGEAWFDTHGLNEAVDETRVMSFAFNTTGLASGPHAYDISVNSHYGQAKVTAHVKGLLYVAQQEQCRFGRGWALTTDRQLFGGPSTTELTLLDGNGRRHDLKDEVLLTDPGLSVRMFADTSVTAMQSFYASSAPSSFTVLRAGQPPSVVTETTVPLPKFWNATGPNLLNLGADGLLDPATSQASPHGDDIILQAPNNQDAFGALLEGYLVIRQAGPVSFAVFADDAFQLEVNGPGVDGIQATLTGSNTSGFVVTPPVTLPAGPVRFRLAYVDHGGNSHLWVVATGGGLPGGVINDPLTYTSSGSSGGCSTPNCAALFSGGIGSSPVVVGRFRGTNGDFTTLARQPQGTYRRDLGDKGYEVYDQAGALIQEVDRNGRTTTYSRGPDERISSITDPAGGVTTITYTGALATSITDAAGRSTTFTYDAQGNLTRITDASGGHWDYTYTQQGLLSSNSDPDGVLHRHEYDVAGRYQRFIHPDGSYQLFQPIESAGLALGSTPATAVVPLAPTAATARHFDELGHSTVLVQTISAPASGSRGAVRLDTIDALQHTTSVVRDYATLLVQRVTRPDGTVTAFTTDFLRGILLSVVQEGDPATPTDDRRTNFGWYSDNWLQSVTSAVGTPLQRTTTIARDVNGNPTAVIDALNHGPTAQYSSDGTLLQTADATGVTTLITRDPATRNVLSYSVNGRNTVHSYDPAGNVTATTFPDGAATHYTWDPMGRLLSVTDPLANATTNTHTPAGRLTTVTNPRSAQVTRSYDSDGKLASTTDPLGRAETYAYLPNGLLQAHTDRNGTTTTYSYDATGNLTSITDPQQQAVFTYDSVGRVTAAVNPTAAVALAYSRFDELVLESTVASGAIHSVVSSYDALGQRTQRSSSLGSSVICSTAYAYDAAGRPASIQESVSDPMLPATTSAFTFLHDAAGRRLQTLASGGVETDYSYDADGYTASATTRLNGIPTAVDVLGYNLRKDVLSILETRTLLPPNATQYQYDAARRLTSEVPTAPGLSALAYAPYDGAGNRRINTHTYDLADELLFDGTFYYDYDPEGAVIARRPGPAPLPRRTFTSDPQGRLVSVTDLSGIGAPTTLATFGYDAFGRRVSRDAVRYWYDREDVILAVDGQAQHTAMTHGPGIDEPLATVDANGRLLLVHDALGSVIQGIRNGTIVGEHRYDAFGNRLTSTGALCPAALDYGYRSREFDGVTELQFNRARYLDAGLARFLRREPLEIRFLGGRRPAFAARYAYALNCPTHYFDPTGLFPSLGGAGFPAVAPNDEPLFPPRTPDYPTPEELIGGLVDSAICGAVTSACETALGAALPFEGPIVELATETGCDDAAKRLCDACKRVDAYKRKFPKLYPPEQ